MSYALLTGSDPAADSVIESTLPTPGRPLWFSFIARFAYSTSPAAGLMFPCPPCAACCAISCAFLMLSIRPIWSPLLGVWTADLVYGRRTLTGAWSDRLPLTMRGKEEAWTQHN